MKIVKVTYTTTSDYSVENQGNIKNVMTALQGLHYKGIRYNACLSADNKTFVHTAFFESEEDQKLLNGLPVFKHFQKQLALSRPEVPPMQELLTLVGASHNIFNS